MYCSPLATSIDWVIWTRHLLEKSTALIGILNKPQYSGSIGCGFSLRRYCGLWPFKTARRLHSDLPADVIENIWEGYGLRKMSV
jgi:hypothetical protein